MASLLFTGASGFLGRNILPALRQDYDCVDTLGRSPGCSIRADLAADAVALPRAYDTVLHAAATVHSPRTAPEGYYDLKAEGTRRLCHALEQGPRLPRRLVFVSSVAVYGLAEGSLVDEDSPTAGTTPYALSKIAAERFLTRWCADRGVALTILRPALIAGIDPPGNLGAMVRAIDRGLYADIGGGHARKSMLMAADIARVLALTESGAADGCTLNLCDDRHPSFGELSALIASRLGKRHAPPSVPAALARAAGRLADCLRLPPPLSSRTIDKVSLSLTFSNARARRTLGWKPLDVLENFHPEIRR